MIFKITSQLFLIFRQEKIKANAKILLIVKENLTRQTRRLLSNKYLFSIGSQKEVNTMHKIFLSTFLVIYETNSPYKKVTVKPKNVKNPWVSKALKKWCIQRQKLYVKYLKQKTTESEKTYKNYKNLFNKLIKKAKNNFYTKKL